MAKTKSRAKAAKATKPTKKAAAPKPAAKVSWQDVTSMLGVAYNDPKLVAFLARVGRRPPRRNVQDLNCKPHGFTFNFSIGTDFGLGDDPIVEDMYVWVKKSPEAGAWLGDLPVGLTRTSTAADAVGEHHPPYSDGSCDVALANVGDLEVAASFEAELASLCVTTKALGERRRQG